MFPISKLLPHLVRERCACFYVFKQKKTSLLSVKCNLILYQELKKKQRSTTKTVLNKSVEEVVALLIAAICCVLQYIIEHFTQNLKDFLISDMKYSLQSARRVHQSYLVGQSYLFIH